MVSRSKHRKSELMSAAVRLVSAGGVATVRAIAQEVGVTEGAVYRHFRSKEDLCWQAYRQIVEEMYHEKLATASSEVPIREKMREWIELTYQYFDRNPQAFTYVLLADGCVPEGEKEITKVQGKLLAAMLDNAIASGELRPLDSGVAVSHFTGLMLNVPRLINESKVQGPASKYVEEVANAIWRVLAP